MVIAAVVCLAAACGHLRPKQEVRSVAAAPDDTVTRVSIVFGGDVMQHMPQVAAARRDSVYDYTETFRHLKPFFDTVDMVVVNLETTLSTSGPYSGYPIFSSPQALAQGLKDCGVDVVMLANNHMADKGLRGVTATMSALDKAGLRHTGFFADSVGYRSDNPLILNAKGVTLALLNYTYGHNGMPVPKGTIANLTDTARIAADLSKIDRRSAEVVIIYFHWGQEYARTPDRSQKALAEWCRSRGADIIVGSHPHVLQPVEIFSDSAGRTHGVTAYSLGNLVSNQRNRYTDGGMLLKIDIEHRNGQDASIDASYMLTWVYTPVARGRRSYIILPSPVADTLLDGSPSEAAYRLFERDSRRLLGGDSVLKEIKADPAQLWERAKRVFSTTR